MKEHEAFSPIIRTAVPEALSEEAKNLLTSSDFIPFVNDNIELLSNMVKIKMYLTEPKEQQELWEYISEIYSDWHNNGYKHMDMELALGDARVYDD